MSQESCVRQSSAGKLTNQSTVKKGKHLKKMHLKDASRGMESRDGGAIGEEEKLAKVLMTCDPGIYICRCNNN